jgi:hypothetical protein
MILRSGSGREEHQRPHLDALPRRSAWCQWVLERGMKRQPRAPVISAVMDADQQRFVSLHLGKIIPAMRWFVLHSRCLAADVSIHEIAGDQVVVRKALTGCQYYVAGRYAAFAGLNPVAGNLLHHAIENFLKGVLSKTKTLDELKKLGHKLPDIWAVFKAKANDVKLAQFDSTISRLATLKRFAILIAFWSTEWNASST